jgi:hypothetical protein
MLVGRDDPAWRRAWQGRERFGDATKACDTADGGVVARGVWHHGASAAALFRDPARPRRDAQRHCAGRHGPGVVRSAVDAVVQSFGAVFPAEPSRRCRAQPGPGVPAECGHAAALSGDAQSRAGHRLRPRWHGPTARRPAEPALLALARDGASFPSPLVGEGGAYRTTVWIVTPRFSARVTGVFSAISAHRARCVSSSPPRVSVRSTAGVSPCQR